MSEPEDDDVPAGVSHTTVNVSAAELAVALKALRNASEDVPEDEHSATQVLDLKQQAELMALRAQSNTAKPTERLDRQIVVMFTDLVGSTAYYDRYGDLKGREKILTHNSILFPLIQGQNGTIVKTIGDSIMAYFNTADDALNAAARMQHALAAHNKGVDLRDDEIHIRVALNAGMAIVQEGDIFGDVVNVAARIEHQAQADEVLMSAGMADASPGWPVESAGSASFKGKSDKVPLFRLRWRDVAQGQNRQPKLPARYAIRELLSRGVLGDAYLADDKTSESAVVIVALHEHLAADGPAKTAFVEAAWAMMDLEHTGVLHVLDCAGPRDEPFYVTENIQGTTLGHVVGRAGPPEPTVAALLVHRVAAVIAAAHAQNVFHRGIGPDSVWVTNTGELRVGGFGMSNVDASLIKRGKNPAGDPAFVAPEQIVAGKVGGRTDVYSLGALLYYLLCGRAPFEDSAGLQGTRVVAAGGFVPIQKVNPDAPEALAEIAAKAMALVPAGRHADVRAFMTELHDYIQDAGGEAERRLTSYLASGHAAASGVTSLTATVPGWLKPLTDRAESRVSLPIGILVAGALLLFAVAFALGRLTAPSIDAEALEAFERSAAEAAPGSEVPRPETLAPAAAPAGAPAMAPSPASTESPAPASTSPAPAPSSVPSGVPSASPPPAPPAGAVIPSSAVPGAVAPAPPTQPAPAQVAPEASPGEASPKTP